MRFTRTRGRVVRWMGAFRHYGDFETSLRWEITQNDREVAATIEASWGDHGTWSNIYANVGLWLDDDGVVKYYPGDVWSVTTSSGRLKATSFGSHENGHDEIFCRPGYVKGIVLRVHPSRMRRNNWEIVSRVARETRTRIFFIHSGKRAGWWEEIHP